MGFDVGGGLSGAASGAALGSSFGPIGTGVGAVAGGLLGAFGRKKRKPKRISTLDKMQQGIYNQYGEGLQGKGKFADLFNFDASKARENFNKSYAQPAYQNFQENVVPGITGQFRGGNLQNSSYLAGALAKAGTDVQRNLDAHLADILYQGQNASIDRRINGINNILNQQTFAYQQEGPSAGEQGFGALLNAGGTAAGNIVASKYGNASGGGYRKEGPLSPLNPGPTGAHLATAGGY